MIGFFYAGDMMLKLFHVDIESFAVAGAFVIRPQENIDRMNRSAERMCLPQIDPEQ